MEVAVLLLPPSVVVVRLVVRVGDLGEKDARTVGSH